MADGFALAVQKGVRAALVADTAITSIVSQRVYDEPPQDAAFPYLRFVEIQPSAFDTDTTEGAEVSISLEAHSRSASGRVEAVRIVEAVKEALHRQEASITLEGHNLVEMIFQTYSVTRDDVGRGYTAVIVLQAMLEEIA